MQQTEKYKLNLIESSDPFLPEGLNQNTQKIEDTLSEYQAKMDGKYLMLDSNLSALVKNVGSGGKTARIAWGSYTGTGQFGPNHPNTLTFDFCPVFVFVTNYYGVWNRGMTWMIRGLNIAMPAEIGADRITVTWQDNGVSYYGDSAMGQNNRDIPEDGINLYCYVAIGYDLNA